MNGASFEHQLRDWICRAKQIDYQVLIFDVTRVKDKKGFNNILQAIQSSNSLRLLTKSVYPINDRKKVRSYLQNIRKKSGTDFIEVKSSNEQVLNYVAKDSRIDLIKCDATSFNQGIASLAGQNNIFIDLSFKELLLTKGSTRSKNIRQFLKIIDLCKKKGTKAIISSDVSQPVYLKHAWQKTITLGQLLDLDLKSCNEIVKKHPKALLEKGEVQQG